MLVRADLTTVAAVWTAVGTVGAVLIALYLQVFREWYTRPRLSLALGDNHSGLGLSGGAAGVTPSIGLRVTAASKRRTAQRVEVLVTAAWRNPEHETSIRVLDHEPLKWIGSTGEHGPLTQTTLGPGISREVSLALIGRPLDLYEPVGLSRPTADDVARADAGEGDNGINTALGVFDVAHRSGGFPLFLVDYLEWWLRIDVTAQDVPTASYETAFRIAERWEGSATPPATHASRNERGVEVSIAWTPVRKVEGVFRPGPAYKIWHGKPFK